MVHIYVRWLALSISGGLLLLIALLSWWRIG